MKHYKMGLADILSADPCKQEQLKTILHTSLDKSNVSWTLSFFDLSFQH